MSARPFHWSLLLLCIAGFCSQPVATGNQSSRGRMGRWQTQPDQCQAPRGSLGLLVTNLGARMTVSATKRNLGGNEGQHAQCPFTLSCVYLFFNQFGMIMEKFSFPCLFWINGNLFNFPNCCPRDVFIASFKFSTNRVCCSSTNTYIHICKALVFLWQFATMKEKGKKILNLLQLICKLYNV